MDFKILGPLEVADEGRELELGGSRQRQLLAILLLHRNELVSSDRLIDHLWGTTPPSAAKGLQVHVSRLRNALGAHGTLVTHAGGYTLRAGVEDVDAARFERLIERGRVRLAAGEATGAADDLRDALGLWRGRPLSD